MSQPRLLLLLALLCATQRSRGALHLYDTSSFLSCLNAALDEARKNLPEENSILDKRGLDSPLPQEPPEEREEEEGEDEELGKRTFPGQGHHYTHVSQGKGKSSQSRAKSDRRAKVTLSLDVPTNIMNILFNIAKAKNLRAKAAANAHLMAQVGRRK
ncbi:Urocortin-3 [Chaetura pelagica]|uniref:urocortin-3 n=1 Tax=Chaetura pelagica TaxID=8897 RepID=UPI0005234330|nr:PREDICTED: urocortin-3 [Chaetura pelagica]KFU89978.1 Urocortin-3 [Chaetura pelagica]